MPNARVFVPQDALETFIADGRAHMTGDTLFVEGTPFQLTSAVRFVSEVAGGGDASGLVGRVKSLEQLTELGGEHAAGSVILGDNAYEIVDGFLAVPETPVPAEPGTHARLTKLFAAR